MHHLPHKHYSASPDAVAHVVLPGGDEQREPELAPEEVGKHQLAKETVPKRQEQRRELLKLELGRAVHYRQWASGRNNLQQGLKRET